MIVFQVFIKFRSSERNTENTMSNLYFNEESDYFKENTCKNEVFHSTIERNQTYASAADLLHTIGEKKILTVANARSSHLRCSAEKCVF